MTPKMNVANYANWLFGTCGKSHFGVYTCSKCGYELLTSGVSPGSKLVPDVKSLFPKLGLGDATKLNGNKAALADFMVQDFTANWGKTFHKNSLVRTSLPQQKEQDDQGPITYQINCGKCGSSLGHQQMYKGYSTFDIKMESIDLTFRAS